MVERIAGGAPNANGATNLQATNSQSLAKLSHDVSNRGSEAGNTS